MYQVIFLKKFFHNKIRHDFYKPVFVPQTYRVCMYVVYLLSSSSSQVFILYFNRFCFTLQHIKNGWFLLSGTIKYDMATQARSILLLPYPSSKVFCRLYFFLLFFHVKIVIVKPHAIPLIRWESSEDTNDSHPCKCIE